MIRRPLADVRPRRPRRRLGGPYAGLLAESLVAGFLADTAMGARGTS